MVTVKPFRALRPTQNSALKVASVPYDVVSRAEARELAKGKPDSFLKVVRSDIDLEDSVSSYDDSVYHKATENLADLRSRGILVEEEEASFYIYQIEAGKHRQTGIIGLSSVDDYESGKVKIHEKTRPEKLEDRIKHMLELKAHTGPVLLTFRDTDEINSIIETATRDDALFSFTAEDGVKHTVWQAASDTKLGQAFAKVPASYIADGHHRAESAKVCRDQMKQKNSAHDGSEEYNFFLTVLFPESELNILPYNRTIKSIPGGADLSTALAQIAEVMNLEKKEKKEPSAKGEFCMYAGGEWYSLSPKQAVSPDPVASLDCSILQDKVLGPVFGIEDPRLSDNVSFVGGIRGTAELEKLVDSGQAIAAFSLHPVTVSDLLSVADSGKTMPPKSTWFEPKLRSGLTTHLF